MARQEQVKNTGEKFITQLRMLAAMLDWIIKEINRNLQSHKEALWEKAVTPGYPKIVLVKLTPKQASKDIDGKYKERRKIFNHALDLAASQYGKYITVNPDIIPADDSAYRIASGYLSESGLPMLLETDGYPNQECS